MKVKLLKKLRKLFELQKRNGEYKVFENYECSGGIYNQTGWISKESAIEIRREMILKEARKYKVRKEVCKN